jgi:tellurite resistance protein TehA-like permease
MAVPEAIPRAGIRQHLIVGLVIGHPTPQSIAYRTLANTASERERRTFWYERRRFNFVRLDFGSHLDKQDLLCGSSWGVLVQSPPCERHNLNQLRVIFGWVGREVSTLDPACFALVMATGTTSNALLRLDQPALSNAMFLLNVAIFTWLVVATIWRMTLFRTALRADLTHPGRVFSFFTLVAASNVLGLQLDLRGSTTMVVVLWSSSLAIWFVLTYFSFGLLFLFNSIPPADIIVRGAWLLAIVGTQSLVLLGTQIAASGRGEYGEAIFVLNHGLWGVGLILYGLFLGQFVHRVLYARVGPSDLTPLLWVIMGAAAISANAGSLLVQTSMKQYPLYPLRPFIDGVSLMVWAWGTWWIPLLAMFAFWKHVVHRVPLSYTPTLWGFVFPLAMYAVATDRLSADFSSLRVLSHLMSWVALVAWAATMGGFIAACVSSFRDFARSRFFTPTK